MTRLIIAGIVLLLNYGLAEAQSNPFFDRMGRLDTLMKDKPNCPFARVRNNLMDMFPVYLFDEKPDPRAYSIRMIHHFNMDLTSFSVLLGENHPSKCQRKVFGVNFKTGILELGGYADCPDEKEPRVLRQRDGFGFDHETKKQFGLERKPELEKELDLLLGRIEKIAHQCP